jgi:quinol monooxygenase YgiN
VLVVTRYQVPEDDEEFHPLARVALAALAARPGCRGATVGRNVDEPRLWLLVTSWRSVGDYRRALSHPEVKVGAVPLMYRCIDEPSAYEDLTVWDPVDGTTEHASDRA